MARHTAPAAAPTTAASSSSASKSSTASPSPRPAPATEASRKSPLAATKPAAMTSARSGSWTDALLPYLERPASFAATHVHSYSADHVVIFDQFPKSKVHLLVMPRMRVGPRGKYLASVEDLDPDNKAHVQVVEQLTTVCAAVEQEMRTTYPQLEFRVGVHAVPSMRHLHVHVVSQDFISDRLKTKQHWNSFTSEFFVPWERVKATLAAGQRVKIDKAAAEAMLKRPLACHKCSKTARTMPELKKHLETHAQSAIAGSSPREENVDSPLA
ncbi:hypothetical protein AMAG_14423 [Allomyces macrogynus ATCC 38327]|uniref:HIT domain-containing protein n=1 Tax=Allomyces macrogynus (strain ATCC 38327) TaxID=578462 RepID=A0A0L0T6G4_ALLM3|nr:hypothetical protein AMAG_14423 [Allomyces macrogynus ATCC 38327]|eukprot:KNE70276.1 hypothetical protein AMAG_14423 [Allomyces macrogynus ATCC 38327]